MASHSGNIGFGIFGGFAEINRDESFRVYDRDITNDVLFRLDGADLDQVFDVGFFPLSESGLQRVDAINTEASGALIPSPDNFEWRNYHRDGPIFVDDVYRYSISTPSKSGYFDLGQSFNVVDTFFLYFYLHSARSGVVYSRGTEAGGVEFEVYITEDGSKYVNVDHYDIFGSKNLLQKEFPAAGPNQNLLFGVSYSGDAVNGEFALGKMFDPESTWERSGVHNARKKVSGAKTHIFKTTNSSSTNPIFDGWVREFGAHTTNGVDVQTSRFSDYLGGGNWHPELIPSGSISDIEDNIIVDEQSNYNGSAAGFPADPISHNVPNVYKPLTNQHGSLTFDSNSYITCGDVTELNNASNFTIECWVNRDSVTDDGTFYLFRKYKDADENIQIYFQNVAANDLFYIYVSNGSTGGLYKLNLGMVSGQWYHFAVVYDGTLGSVVDRLKFYMDGSLVSTTPDGSVASTSADVSGINAFIGLSSSSWVGKIDEFRIYTESFTLSQVQERYAGNEVVGATPILEYKFNYTDSSYVGQFFSPGVGGIRDSFVTFLEPENEDRIYDFVSPLTSGTIQSKLVVDHITNHSVGVCIRPKIEYYAGAQVLATWEGSGIVPSGERQEITIKPDLSKSSGFTPPLLYSDLTNIRTEVNTEFDNNSSNSYYSDLKIYSFDVETDAWFIAPTGTDAITLFASGDYATDNANLDLYLYGHILDSGTLDLYQHGHILDSGNISLYTVSADTSSSGVSLFTKAFYTDNANMPMYITTGAGTVASGDIDLYTYGATTDLMYKKVNLFTKSEHDPNYSMNLYTIGPSSLSQNANMNLYLKHGPFDVSGNLNLYTMAPSGSSDSLALYVEAPSGTLGAIPVTSNMNLFIARSVNSHADGMPLYLFGEPFSGSMPLFIQSVYFEDTLYQLVRDDKGSIDGTAYNTDYDYWVDDNIGTNLSNGRSMYFDGTTYVDMDTDVRDVLPPGDKTMSLWLNPTSGYLSGEYFYFYDYNQDTLELVGCKVLTSNLTANQWQYVVAQNSGNTYEVYIDNILSSASISGTLNSAVNDIDTEVTLGRSFDYLEDGVNDSGSFYGYIDDFRVFNRALTSSERNMLYNGSGVADGFVTHWSMDDSPPLRLFINGAEASGITNNTSKLYTHGLLG